MTDSLTVFIFSIVRHSLGLSDAPLSFLYFIFKTPLVLNITTMLLIVKVEGERRSLLC